MDLTQYLEPVNISYDQYLRENAATPMANCITTYTNADNFPDIENDTVAMVGVIEDRGAVGNSGCARGADQVRHYLYGLSCPHCLQPDEDNSIKSDPRHKIYDLGNIMAGETLQETHYALTQVAQELFSRNVTLIILGGGQDLSYAIYKAYEIIGRVVNICSVDPRFDIGMNDIVDSRNYIYHIVMQKTNNYLFNYTTLGYQSYFVSQPLLNLMDALHFDFYRLGLMQEDINRTEPLVRNADFVSVDISSVRQSDAPGNAHPSPHGFYGEELCQISRFAGLSDKLSCIGFFEMNPLYDNAGQTAHMMAHAIWYFIDGFFNRKADFPHLDKQNYNQYLVQLESHGLEMAFYKSRKSDRWWVEVPCQNEEMRERIVRHLLIPCNYSDYEKALRNEIPDLWWRYYQRIQW